MNQQVPVLMLTEAAQRRVRELLARRPSAQAVLRIGVKPLGCSGLSYVIEYADRKGPDDAVVEVDGATVCIDPQATVFLLGSEMDYVDGKLNSGFVFTNPNEKGRCGCGESFHV